jgi:hypothetical protein
VLRGAQTEILIPAVTCLLGGEFDVNSLTDKTVEVEVHQVYRPLLDDFTKLHNDLVRPIQRLELSRCVNNG